MKITAEYFLYMKMSMKCNGATAYLVSAIVIT